MTTSSPPVRNVLDLAVDGPLPSAHAITSEDLERAEERLGARVESGDALARRGVVEGWIPAAP